MRTPDSPFLLRNLVKAQAMIPNSVDVSKARISTVESP